jgi:hypothetical protein
MLLRIAFCGTGLNRSQSPRGAESGANRNWRRTMGDQISGSLLWAIALADVGIACAYGYDSRWPLALVYLAYAISQAAMAWV